MFSFTLFFPQLYCEATLVFPLIVAETFAQRVSLPHVAESTKDDRSKTPAEEIIKWFN